MRFVVWLAVLTLLRMQAAAMTKEEAVELPAFVVGGGAPAARL